MIIDTHLHYGNYGQFHLNHNTLQQQMDENGIGKGIISSIECCEYLAEKDELMPKQISQLKANQELLEAVKTTKERFYLSFWCKPATENNIDEVYTFIRDNREYVKGLKLHPFYSRMALEDNRYDSYIDIAGQLNLPVSVHTANDKLSNPMQLLSMAKRFPKVYFIMVHLGLCSDNELAIDCLAKADNLIGDTTWVPYDKVKKAIRVCGSEKMIFGSDAPIDGDKSYSFYQMMLKEYVEKPTGELENLMYKNAFRIFGL